MDPAFKMNHQIHGFACCSMQNFLLIRCLPNSNIESFKVIPIRIYMNSFESLLFHKFVFFFIILFITNGYKIQIFTLKTNRLRNRHHKMSVEKQIILYTRICLHIQTPWLDGGVVETRTHNPKVVGSSPAPGSVFTKCLFVHFPSIV